MQKDLQSIPRSPATEMLYRQDSSVVDQHLGSNVVGQKSDVFNMTPARRLPLANLEAMPTNPLAFRQSPQIFNDPGALIPQSSLRFVAMSY